MMMSIMLMGNERRSRVPLEVGRDIQKSFAEACMMDMGWDGMMRNESEHAEMGELTQGAYRSSQLGIDGVTLSIDQTHRAQSGERPSRSLHLLMVQRTLVERYVGEKG